MFYGIVGYSRSTIIICVLYTQGNSQKLAEWVKKGTSPQLPLEGAEGKGTNSSASCRN